MNEILVTGHKNPDTDSACAAWCYAQLKNAVEPELIYRSVVCGPLNAQTRYVFERAGVEPPEFVRDVYPRVIDIARNDGMRLDINDPVFEAIKDLDEHTISVIPVFEHGDEFKGIIGIHEIASYVVRTGTASRQRYIFNTGNIEKVIPGRYLKRGVVSDIKAPIMIGAMNYEKSVERIQSMLPEKPVLVCGNRFKLLSHAIAENFPAIILTNCTEDSYFTLETEGYQGSIYLSNVDTAETVRLLWLSAPVKLIMNPEPIVVNYDQVFDDAKKILLSSDLRGIPVVREGKFAGVVTRRSFIEKPRKSIIMVDHNEASQSINGAAEAEVLEIIDHHRLAPEKTSKPIYVFAKPVGSTCTLVYQHYLMHNVPIDRVTALLLLSGVLSDTLFLKSPTTTPEDARMVEECAWIAGVDVGKYSNDLVSCMTVLKNTDPMKVISGDFKIYRERGIGVGIAQVETITLEDIFELKGDLLAALEAVRRERSLEWVMILITDVIHSHSNLLVTAHPKFETELVFKKIDDNLYDLPDILSRKKQLLPEILRVLEDVSGDFVKPEY